LKGSRKKNVYRSPAGRDFRFAATSCGELNPNPDKAAYGSERNNKLQATNYNIQISNKIKSQLFGILKFGHCDLPFDLAQGGGESFDSAQDREPVERLVEPFDICVLLFEIFDC
jgi:hypothetical protein